ncbi:BglG family transcription antiterminator [Peribacillus frigoritolerans]|uniref:BglG family transcription antiterminator n=1 Tax=Peribacillus frigoritolerans TaxID=450367 RepID=UPI00207B0D58|nr:BglG family transcription antiterminator [Peribacillus frigoritolerans]USK68258.1 BglG family transcription antiterminator [Peribacillus frigoritolerans]
MILSDRDKKILDELTSNPSITSMTLEKKYSLTRRQLGYSIDKINDWLITNKLPVIERTRQGHFVIDQAVFAKLFGNHEGAATAADTTILTEEQRVQLIIMILLSSEEELSLNHFTFELNVSKNTILSDLKEAQGYLDDYDLTIRYSRKHGYLIEGKEFQVRKLLMNITYLVLQMSNGEQRLRKLSDIPNEQINEFTKRVEKVENKLNLKFTDEKMKTMPFILILIKRRIEKGHIINSFSIEYEKLSDTKEYKATEEILYDMKDIPVSERLFITLHLLTTNVFSSEIITDETVPNLVPAIDNMLRHFEKSACIYFQDREHLLDKLLQHIKPAYYRIKYQLTDTFLFQGSLSKEFKELHHLVKRSIGPLKELIGTDIPENEIAFITMLIGGWMKRQGESIDKKVKAIVVCPQGVSVSRLMFNELKELFPEFVFLDFLSVREFLNYALDYDIVFSPIFLETEKKLFVTKAFLGREEKYLLRKQVMLGVHGYIPNVINVNHILEAIANHATIHNEKALIEDLEKYFNRDEDAAVVKQNVDGNDINLDELIVPENITLIDSVDSWEDAIRISAKPLIESGKIQPEYADAMIRYCEKDSYIVIGPNIAIPHAAPEDGANEVGMSMLRVKDGVRYTNDYNINLIITISAVDKQQHIHALMQLMNLSGSEKERNKVINADSIEEIYEVIQVYSKD